MTEALDSGFREALPVPILDHGYVRLIETWGSDERIIESARMSTGKGFKGWGSRRCDCCGPEAADNPARVIEATLHNLVGEENVAGPENFDKMADYCEADPACKKCKGTGRLEGDEKLLRFLWENKHYTPFEMAGATFEIQAPLFVFREWHRHRTQSYNEMSGRYTVLPDLVYVPSVERIMDGAQSKTNKQSSGPGITKESAELIRVVLSMNLEGARGAYTDLLQMGLARELARLVIPVAQYSRMRASANLRNWLGFLTLRLDPAVQWEMRQYAECVHGSLCAIFPRTLRLFTQEWAKRAGPF